MTSHWAPRFVRKKSWVDGEVSEDERIWSRAILDFGRERVARRHIEEVAQKVGSDAKGREW